jgi:hypothetical protein
LKEAFSRFENFSPCFKCFSFDLNKTPPQCNSPLSVQEGFRYSIFESGYTNLKYVKNKIPIENLFKKLFKIGGGAVLLLWDNTFSPFSMNRQKRILCE